MITYEKQKLGLKCTDMNITQSDEKKENGGLPFQLECVKEEAVKVNNILSNPSESNPYRFNNKITPSGGKTSLSPDCKIMTVLPRKRTIIDLTADDSEKICNNLSDDRVSVGNRLLKTQVESKKINMNLRSQISHPIGTSHQQAKCVQNFTPPLHHRNYIPPPLHHGLNQVTKQCYPPIRKLPQPVIQNQNQQQIMQYKIQDPQQQRNQLQQQGTRFQMTQPQPEGTRRLSNIFHKDVAAAFEKFGFIYDSQISNIDVSKIPTSLRQYVLSLRKEGNIESQLLVEKNLKKPKEIHLVPILLGEILPESVCKFLQSKNIFTNLDLLKADTSKYSELATALMIAKRSFREDAYKTLQQWKKLVISDEVNTSTSNSLRNDKTIVIPTLAEVLNENIVDFLAGEKINTVQGFINMDIELFSPLTTALLFKGKQFGILKRNDSYRFLLNCQATVKKKKEKFTAKHLHEVVSDKVDNSIYGKSRSKTNDSYSSSSKKTVFQTIGEVNNDEVNNNNDNYISPQNSVSLKEILSKDDCNFLASLNITNVSQFKQVNKAENSLLVSAWLKNHDIFGEAARKSCAAMIKLWENNVDSYCQSKEFKNRVLVPTKSRVARKSATNVTDSIWPQNCSVEFPEVNKEKRISSHSDQPTSLEHMNPRIVDSNQGHKYLEQNPNVLKREAKSVSKENAGEKYINIHTSTDNRNHSEDFYRKRQKVSNSSELNKCKEADEDPNLIPQIDHGSEDLFVMNEAQGLCRTEIDPKTNLPIKYVSVYDDSGQYLYVKI